MNNNVIKILIYLFGLFVCFIDLHSATPAKKISISFFPNEDADYTLGKMGSFDFYKGAIFYCSGNQHEVMKIDLSGKLLNRFGRNGQGPGEFNGPSHLRIMADKIYIYDGGNGRFQIFSLDGKYERQFKILERMCEYKVYSDKLYIHPWRPQPNNQNIVPIIEIYTNNGEKEKEIVTTPFKRLKHDDQQYAYILSIELYNDQIHCLQKYGTNYRIYDLEGKLVSDISLDGDPLSASERKNMHGWLWAYNTFCVDGDHIYANCAKKGKVLIHVFDMRGRLEKLYESPQQSDDIYSCSEMKIISVNKKKYLLMLLRIPDCSFGIFEIE